MKSTNATGKYVGWKFRRLCSSFGVYQNGLGVSKSAPIPATRYIVLRHGSKDKVVVDIPFREIVGSLMWTANQTRPDIWNAVRAIARFLLDHKPIHCNEVQKILEHLNTTSDSELTFRRDDD